MTSEGRVSLPSEQLFDLAVVEVKEMPKSVTFIASGLLDTGEARFAPSYNIYRMAEQPDRYFIELYEVNLWNVTDELKPCAVAELYLAK
jgi:hypothetical protein